MNKDTYGKTDAANRPGGRPNVVRTADGERIAKRLARAGVASRRDAELMIAAGRVSVNGKVLVSPAFNVTESDRIEIDGHPIPAIERTRLFLFHKPAGVVTTTRDPEGRKTVFDILPAGLPRLLSVGRLDITTEGLLLLTNDGGLSRVLELPATGWLRRYRVRVHGTPDEEKLAALKDGIAVDGVFYGSVEASVDRIQGSNAWLVIGLREGKNREVRNILGALGLTVNRLIRVSYGPFQLADLPVGEIREIKGRTLKDQLGERLIAEAGANFEAPVAIPFSKAAAEPQQNKPEVTDRKREPAARPPRPVGKRPEKRTDKREDALGRLHTKPGRPDRKPREIESGHNRASHVWMAPGARPLGKKRTAEAEAAAERAAKRDDRSTGSQKKRDDRNRPGNKTRSSQADAKGSNQPARGKDGNPGRAGPAGGRAGADRRR